MQQCEKPTYSPRSRCFLSLLSLVSGIPLLTARTLKRKANSYSFTFRSPAISTSILLKQIAVFASFAHFPCWCSVVALTTDTNAPMQRAHALMQLSCRARLSPNDNYLFETHMLSRESFEALFRCCGTVFLYSCHSHLCGDWWLWRAPWQERSMAVYFHIGARTAQQT